MPFEKREQWDVDLNSPLFEGQSETVSSRVVEDEREAFARAMG